MRNSGHRLSVLNACTLLVGTGQLLLGVWLAIFDMPLTAAFVLGGSAAVALHSLGVPFVRRARALLVAVALLAMTVGWAVPVHEFQQTHQRLRRLKDTRGAAAFSTRDLAGVYGLHLLMGVGGYGVGLSEVATETLHLTLRGATVRAWHSNFAMRSARIRSEINAFAEFARHQSNRVEQVTLPTRHVSWSRYALDDDSLRVALALNSPAELTGTAHREGGRWRLELVARARIEYPRQSVLSLAFVDGQPVEFDEGLYWVLQEAGWLHPYVAEWRWVILSDDSQVSASETAVKRRAARHEPQRTPR